MRRVLTLPPKEPGRYMRRVLSLSGTRVGVTRSGTRVGVTRSGARVVYVHLSMLPGWYMCTSLCSPGGYSPLHATRVGIVLFMLPGWYMYTSGYTPGGICTPQAIHRVVHRRACYLGGT